jgi:uncharacterized membrane protein
MQERPFNAKVIAILVLAFAVRLLGIASRPIWYDEAFSILFAEKGLNAMLIGTLTTLSGNAAEEHPLGYYTLLWLWMKLFGESLVVTRLLSILAGLISVYLVYLIGLGMLSDARTARSGMLFAAVAPFQVHYAQEVRMYSFLGLWLLLATYAYQRGSRTRDWKWWGLFSISAALAQYTHNLAAFYLVPLALLPIFQKDWQTLRAVVIAAIGSLILYFPWLVQLPAQFSKVENTYWVERPDISKLFTLILVFVTNTPLPAGFVAAALAIALIVVMVGLIQTIRLGFQAGTKIGFWLLYLSFAPPLFLFLFSQWRSVYVERALLPSGAMFCIWLAWAITATNLSKIARYTLIGLLALASILGIYQHLTYQDFPYGPFRELSTSLHQRLEVKDVIVHSNKLSLLPALVFDNDLPQLFIADPGGSSTDTLASATQKILNLKAEKDITTATEYADRVWYIVYQRAIDEYIAAGYPTHPDLQYLDSQFHLSAQETWDGLRVFLYSKEP